VAEVAWAKATEQGFFCCSGGAGRGSRTALRERRAALGHDGHAGVDVIATSSLPQENRACGLVGGLVVPLGVMQRSQALRCN
jgi:hypothetical protein